MARSKPRYTQAEQELIEDLRSRMNVSRGIIERRAELGLTQADLGRQAKTKQSRVSEVESMKGNPRFNTLDNITRVLGLMLTVVPRVQEAPQAATIGNVYFGEYVVTERSDTIIVATNQSYITPTGILVKAGNG